MALNGPNSFVSDRGTSFNSSMGVISSVMLCSSVVDFDSPINKVHFIILHRHIFGKRFPLAGDQDMNKHSKMFFVKLCHQMKGAEFRKSYS